MPDIPFPPALQAPLTAFLVALVAAGVIRLAGGPDRGGRLAGAAVGLGVIAAWALYVGLPIITPRHVIERIPVVVAAGLVAGIALDIARAGATTRMAAGAVFALAGAWWMVGLPGLSPWQLRLLVKAAILAAAWALVLVRLGRAHRDARTPLVMLVMSALGLAAIAQGVGNVFFMLPAFLVAAAALGVLALTWAGPRVEFAAAALLAGAGALMAGASALWLSAGGLGAGLALLVLGLVFFAEGVAERAQVGPGLLRRVTWPLTLGLVCLAPAVLAGLIAYLAGRIP